VYFLEVGQDALSAHDSPGGKCLLVGIAHQIQELFVVAGNREWGLRHACHANPDAE
jgi:hypothetical protein